MKNNLSGFFLLLCLFCYSKEIFYYDEELIIVTCLFIVFFVLNEKFSKSVGSFFEKKLNFLKETYCSNFSNEEKYQEIYEKQLVFMSITNIKIARLLAAVKVSFLYFFSFNYYIVFIYFKLIINEFFNFLLISEKLFEKNINLFFLNKVLNKVDFLIKNKNKISFKENSKNFKTFL
jgi:Mitochondrial ATP synthase B chain precursor (ATP-synt_B)